MQTKMSTASNESLTEPTKCPLCREYYETSSQNPIVNKKQKQSIKRPLILTGCGHTFCEECLMQWLLTEDGPLPGDRLKLKCPKCKTSTYCMSVSELPVNLCILESLELNWNRLTSGGRDRHQSQRPHNETVNERIYTKSLKESSNDGNNSAKFEKRFVPPKVFPRNICPKSTATPDQNRSRRISVNSFPPPDLTEVGTSGYPTTDNMEKRRSRSFSNEPCFDSIGSSTPNIPSCPEFEESSIPEDFENARHNILWNRMSGFPLRPLAFNPKFVPSMKTSQSPFNDGKELPSLDNKENGNVEKIQKFNLAGREHETLLRRKKVHFSKNEMLSAVVYHSKINKATENEDLVSPTRLAVASDGGTLALVDQPSDSVHVISTRSGLKRLIRVDGVKSCCFLTERIMAITTSGGIKLFNVFGHLLNEVALDSWPSVACVSMSGKRFCVAFPQHVSIYSFEKSCFLIKKIKSKIQEEVGNFLIFSKKRSRSIGFENIVDIAWNSHCKHFAVLETVSKASACKNLGKNRKRTGNSEYSKHTVSVFDENGSLLSTFPFLTLSDDPEIIKEPHYIALDRELSIFIASKECGLVSKYTFREDRYSATPTKQWSVSQEPSIDISKSNGCEVRGLFSNESKNSIYAIALRGGRLEVRMYDI